MYIHFYAFIYGRVLFNGLTPVYKKVKRQKAGNGTVLPCPTKTRSGQFSAAFPDFTAGLCILKSNYNKPIIGAR